MIKYLLALTALSMSPLCYGGTHKMNMVSRSYDSQSNTFYLQQKLSSEGSQLKYSLNGEEKKAKFSGFGMETALGVEVANFVRFSLHHTYSESKNNTQGLMALRGSRLGGETTFILTAPIFNIEVGGGIQAAKYDFQNKLETADFTGLMSYGVIGVETFLTNRISISGQFKGGTEKLLKKSGTLTELNDGGSRMIYNYGAGVSIWF